MEPITLRRIARSRSRGLNLIEVLVAVVVLTVAGIAMFSALSSSTHASGDPEAKAVAQTDVSNVQTDLNALSMYNPAPITSLKTGKSVTITPSAAPAGSAYSPSDTKAITITLKPFTPNAANTSAQVNVTYSIPNANATPFLSGSTTVTLSQRAPSTTCDASLHALGKC